MRSATTVVLAAIVSLGSMPSLAQTAGGLAADKTPMAMPDLKGNDPDLICFAVMASRANDAKKADKPNTMLDSAAGYYAGRLSIRYPDSGSSLRPWVAKMLKQSSNESATPYFAPCLQRYGAQLLGLMEALQGGQADVK